MFFQSPSLLRINLLTNFLYFFEISSIFLEFPQIFIDSNFAKYIFYFIYYTSIFILSNFIFLKIFETYREILEEMFFSRKNNATVSLEV